MLTTIIRQGNRFLVYICILFLWGCSASISGTLVAPTFEEQPVSLQAGAAKVDITPLPGMAMGGYSIVGTTGRGYWTRLYARSIYLCDEKGKSFVMVSCDLWSVSGGLADRVAELVSTQGKKLSREQIILAATHTHHSPGNFSTAPMYNEFASYRNGFDPNLFEFFAQRIAYSITTAIDNSEPAHIALHTKKVPGVIRNRSLDAFLLNVDSNDILQKNTSLPVEKKLDFPREAYHAVDPRLTVLNFYNTNREIIAAAAFFAVHPTVMGAKTEVYHSDLFGVITTKAEQYLRRQGVKKPIVALFNGAEGDISPNWEQRDRRNTLLLGTKIAETLITLLQQPSTTKDPSIEYNFERVKIDNRCFELKDIERCTAKEPSVGVATLGGATDGRSRLHSFLWREHVKGTRSATQGTKQAPNNPLRMELPFFARFVLDSLMGQIEPPQECPLGVYRLGNIIFVTMPGEFTTTLGQRIENSIAQATNCRVITLGLTNEYISYFTTPEEYEMQRYEAASTLYGPFSGAFIRQELLRLAKNLKTETRQEEIEYSYHPGKYREFSVLDIGAEPYLIDDGLSNLVQDIATGRPVRNYPHFTWTGKNSNWPQTVKMPVTPRVHLQMKKNNEWRDLYIDRNLENDEGLNFVTIALHATPDKIKWGCIWMRPNGYVSKYPIRFAIKKVSREMIYSKEFR